MAGANSGKIIDVNIVAEDRPLWSGEATSVVVPTSDGYIGFLADHEPTLALVGTGTVLVKGEGLKKQFDVTGGFISFEGNVLTVGVDSCLKTHDDESDDAE